MGISSQPIARQSSSSGRIWPLVASRQELARLSGIHPKRTSTNSGIQIMNRQQWKDLLEAIGFLAIIGSLYFVGVETQNSARQTALNTQATEIAAYQALTANISEMNAVALANEDVAAIMLRMRDRGLDEAQSYQLVSALYLQFRHGDIAYFMYERGVIDEPRLKSTLRPLPLAGATGLKFWDENKFVFIEGYQRYVDALIEDGFFARRDSQ